MKTTVKTTHAASSTATVERSLLAGKRAGVLALFGAEALSRQALQAGLAATGTHDELVARLAERPDRVRIQIVLTPTPSQEIMPL